MREEKNKAIPCPEDYIGQDGLLYCGKCKGKKQSRLSLFGMEMIVPALCFCEQETIRLEEQKRREMEQAMQIKRAKASCIHDQALLHATFEKDDGTLEQMKSARRYVETWEKRKAENTGLLLWGPAGTGKTFYAACIANALIEKGVPVLMTSIPKILNQISGAFQTDRNEMLQEMMRYHLLILDDFGVERESEYSMEQLFLVVDERYKSRLPLIVTTNYSMDRLLHPADLTHQRIYDRLLSMCIPIRFSGKDYRKEERERKYRSGGDLFTEKAGDDKCRKK